MRPLIIFVLLTQANSQPTDPLAATSTSVLTNIMRGFFTSLITNPQTSQTPAGGFAGLVSQINPQNVQKSLTQYGSALDKLRNQIEGTNTTLKQDIEDNLGIQLPLLNSTDPIDLLNITNIEQLPKPLRRVRKSPDDANSDASMPDEMDGSLNNVAEHRISNDNQNENDHEYSDTGLSSNAGTRYRAKRIIPNSDQRSGDLSINSGSGTEDSGYDMNG